MRSIQMKLTTMMLVIFLVALGTLGGLNYWKARDIITETVTHNMVETTAQSAYDIGEWLGSRRKELTLLSVTPMVQRGNPAEMVPLMSNAVKANNLYRLIGYATPDGNFINSAGATGNILDREYFQKALQGEIAMSDLLFSRFGDNAPVVLIAVPVKNADAIIGVLFGSISAETLTARVLDVKIGKTGHAFVMQGDGLVAIHPDNTIAMNVNLLTDTNVAIGQRTLARQMLGGQAGVSSQQINGIGHYYAYAPIPDTNWSLGVTVPIKEITDAVSVLTDISAIIIAFVLIFAAIVIAWFARRISKPIEVLDEATRRIAAGDTSAVNLNIDTNDEIGRLGQSFELMSKNLHFLLTDNTALQREIAERLRIEKELAQANIELNTSLDELKRMQAYLVQSEKMAALGGLVAGVAHEINTPVGISLTASSYLAEATKQFITLCQDGTVRKQDLKHYLEALAQSSAIIQVNLERAAQLIQSFKQVSLDQVTEDQRVFNVKKYLEEILLSLHAKTKSTKHHITIDCPADLMINGFPGAFAQVVTNLIMNSLIHAYEPEAEGNIHLQLQRENEHMLFTYSDDGAGMPQAVLNNIFEPFFTTKRGSGCSGLGLYTVYRIITQKFGGTIECDSAPGKGAIFRIHMPIQLANLTNEHA